MILDILHVAFDQTIDFTFHELGQRGICKLRMRNLIQQYLTITDVIYMWYRFTDILELGQIN